MMESSIIKNFIPQTEKIKHGLIAMKGVENHIQWNCATEFHILCV